MIAYIGVVSKEWLSWSKKSDVDVVRGSVTHEDHVLPKHQRTIRT